MNYMDFVLIAFLVVAFYGFVVLTEKETLQPVNLSCPEPVCEKPELSCPQTNCQNLDYFEMKKVCLAASNEKSQLQTIAENNAKEHEYILDQYDCTEFSNNLIQRLKNAGYSASFCSGSSNFTGKGGGHDWVKVENVFIEATTGKILEPDYYALHYANAVCG